METNNTSYVEHFFFFLGRPNTKIRKKDTYVYYNIIYYIFLKRIKRIVRAPKPIWKLYIFIIIRCSYTFYSLNG